MVTAADGADKAAGRAALVLFSGGQDSATCLAWALARYDRVETLAFDYRQRHRVELDCRHAVRQALGARGASWGDWADRLGEDHLIDLSNLAAISDTALTREAEIRMTDAGLPSTFVPGRNLLFFVYAAAIAYRRGIRNIVGGMCETDYSGYPDCRDDTIKALQAAVSLGLDRRMTLHTPLMWRDKAATWRLAEELGGKSFVELVRVETHSCYLGDRATLHPWGYGCSQCPACELRRKGWREYAAG